LRRKKQRGVRNSHGFACEHRKNPDENAAGANETRGKRGSNDRRSMNPITKESTRV
jgi:hypothetical protein